MKRLALGLGFVLAGLIAWEVAASYLFIAFGRMTWLTYGDDLDYPFLVYIIRCLDEPTRWTKTLLAVSGIIPPAVVAALAYGMWRSMVFGNFRRRFVRWPWQAAYIPERRGVTDNHGHAAFMTDPDARAFFGSPRSGKAVGQFATRRLLLDDCTQLNGVSVEFAAPGGGKTSGAVTTVHHWNGPVLVHDPSCEMGPMMWRHLEALGRRVIIVAPDRAPRDPATGELMPWAHLVEHFNVLDWFNIDDPLAGMHIASVVAAFFDDSVAKTDSGTFFRDAAKDLIECILAHVLWASREHGGPAPTLAAVRQVISSERTQGCETCRGKGWVPVKTESKTNETERSLARRGLTVIRASLPPLDAPDTEECPDCKPSKRLRVFLTAVQAHSPSAIARRKAGVLANEPDRTLGNILGEAAGATSWLTADVLAEMVSGNDFRTRDLLDHGTVVFLAIPMSTLQRAPGLARVVVAAFLNMLIARDGQCPWTLFLLDEAWLLGQMAELRTALFSARKYRLALHMMWQSVAQMEEIWKRDGLKYWLDSATWVAYSSVADIEVAERISKAMGTYGVLAYSEGDNTGGGLAAKGRSRGRNTSTHEIRKNVVDPYAVMTDFGRDDLIVMVRGKPLLLKRALWWQQPELAHSIERSRFQMEEAAE